MRDFVEARPRGGSAARVRENAHTAAIEYSLAGRVPDPVAWARRYADALRGEVRDHGLVLLRGLPVEIEAFDAVVAAIGGTALEYTERSTPRSRVSGNIYTSTEYPPDQEIPLHNESSYADAWPETVFFFCQTAPATGGATPVADSRAVHRLIPGPVRDGLASGVRYTRTFRDGMGLGWREAFQTSDRRRVEDHCRAHGQEFAWDGDVLRTAHVRPAVQRDPRTGADLWFNQAHLFHVSALDPEIREALRTVYAEEDLPRNAYRADGSPIPDGDLDRVRAAYAEAALALPWEPGTIMIVNNLLMAHGRRPYTGDRRILVAMT
ncbi:TauD/TfdA family dioxygenase [Spirillospora sp. CA-253888]